MELGLSGVGFEWSWGKVELGLSGVGAEWSWGRVELGQSGAGSKMTKQIGDPPIVTNFGSSQGQGFYLQVLSLET